MANPIYRILLRDYNLPVFHSSIFLQGKQDSQNITSAVTAHLATGNLAAIDGVMQAFFENESPGLFGIIGLAILDRNKKVISAYSAKMGEKAADIVGYSYSGIKFKGDKMAAHKILTLFRTDKENRMGTKGVEIAYEIRQENGDITNWLIFQLEMEHLDREYGIDTKTLARIDFKND